ncbi:MAG TPA: MFS transporter [Stellaceae bacterium]|nr:MFS transporter [Stellaceae bacterium]
MHYRRGWVALMLFSLTLINYIDRATLSFAIEPIAREFGLSTVAKGYLFSSFLWTYTLFLIPMGFLVDRFGAKRVAGFGIGLWSLATACTGLASSFSALLASRLVMGGGEASTNPSGARVIREWIPARERGLLNACFNCGAYAGPAVCALAAGPIIGAFGWPVLFFVAGGLGFAWLAVWLALFKRPEEASWLSETERRTILTQRTGGRRLEPGAASGLLHLLRGPTLWGLALAIGCNVYSQYLFLTWLPSYLRTTKGLNLTSSGLYTAVPYGIAVILCIAIGLLSDRLLRRQDVAGGGRRNLIACAMGLAAIILLAPVIDSLPVLIGLLALSLTGVASTTSQIFSLTNDLLPNPRDIGVAMGFVIVGGNIFGMLAPIVTGYVIDATGSYSWAFVIAGCLLALGAASILGLTRQPIGRGWGRAIVPSQAQA